ncbi:MAG: hypothetical protein H6R10_3479 [Rhodocyclaceae bacterium]|nr:hypothetical protein [Rhodocyclaceae bacterium]
MSITSEYSRLTETAYQALSKVEGNPLQLTEPFRTIVLVDTAKGIIDNGGIRYFFESNFPFTPEYSVFSAAFRNIGLVQAANDMDRAVAKFPFSEPHLHPAMRNEFMRTVESDPSGEFQSAGDSIMDDTEFEARVLSYARKFGVHAA